MNDVTDGQHPYSAVLDPCFLAWGDSLSNPMVVVRATDRRIVYANEALISHAGLNADDLSGAPLTTVLPHVSEGQWLTLSNNGEAHHPLSVSLNNTSFDMDVSHFEYRGTQLVVAQFHSSITGAAIGKELSQARDLLAISQRLLNAGLWEWDANEDRLFWTPETYHIFGVDQIAFTPTLEGFRAMVHPDDLPIIEATAKEVASQKGLSVEFRIVRPDGEVRRIRDDLTPYVDQSGALQRVVGVLQDVTDQWRVDEAFRMVATGIAGASEKDYFVSLTNTLTTLLAIDAAIVAEWDETSSTFMGIAGNLRGEEVSLSNEGQNDNDESRRFLTDKASVIINSGARDRFPNLPAPDGFAVDGMVAVPLLSHGGDPLGIVAVMDGAPLRDPELILGLLEIFSHRTAVELERLQNMTALKRSEARFQSVVHTTMQGFWLIDNQANTMEVNPRMADILGVDPESLPGRSIYDFVDDDNRRIFASQLLQRDAGKHSAYEIGLTRSDGREIACLFSASPFYDNRGIKKGSFALVSDISDRKAIEEESRRSEANMQRAQRIARIGSWVWRIDSDQLELSEQGKVILDRANDVGDMTLSDFLEGISEKERMELLDAIDETLNGEGGFYKECLYDNGRGNLSNLIVEGEADRNAQGHIVGLMGIMQDVTRQRRLEQERSELEIRYREAQKLESLGLVAGGINHDFNNILQQLLGLVNLLSSVDGVESAPEYLKMMRGVIDRGNERLGRLLAFSRQSLDSSERIDPCALVSKLVEEFAAEAPGEVVISAECETTHDTALMADPGQLRHAIANLMRNALDAVDGSGTIKVVVSPCPGPSSDRAGEEWVQIVVEDSGPGIDPMMRDKLFDPFFTTRTGREGLGLSVTHGIVKAHGGELYIENPPNHGARFLAYFPTVASESAPTPTTPPAVSTVEKEPLRIYFLDDEDLIVTTMAIMLRRFAVETIGFTTPEDLLEAFAADDGIIDGVVTDLSMNEISGIDLARKIKEQRPEMPVLLCTGFSPDKDWTSEERDAVDAILYKPVEPEQLVKALAGVRAAQS